MRKAFVEELCAAAAADPTLWLLTADLGFGVLEPFAERFPERYLNVGIAEQNMIGVAAGLALSGKRVVTYSIINFTTLRNLEQIRNDVVYQGLPVTIIAVGSGFTYGSQGYTHHGLEDLAVMRSLGTIDVASPADGAETRMVMRLALGSPGPTYVRLGKTGEPAVHESAPESGRGGLCRLREGDAALIVATGGLVAQALVAAELLDREGIAVAVWSAPWVNPFDAPSMAVAAREYGLILSAEEGVMSGGLGAAVATAVAELAGNRARLVIAGAPGDAKHQVMSQETARAAFQLDGAGLAARIKSAL